MARAVLDASALLAFINGEPGGEVVAEHLSEAVISSVNYSESIAKLVSRNAPLGEAVHLLRQTDVEVIDFDRQLAEAAAGLIAQTRRRGLSFADRACLALARREQALVLSADRNWSELTLGVDITFIR